MLQIPPYTSWAAFINALDSLGPATPTIVDLATLGGRPSTSSQALQALRFLGLVTTTGEPTPDLRMLVEHSGSRVATLTKVLRQSYPAIFGQKERGIQLENVQAYLAETGLKAATKHKALLFIRHAAAFIGHPVNVVAITRNASYQSPPQTTTSRQSFALELNGGGMIEVAIEMNPFLLSKEDREFVFDLIDRLKDYQAGRARTKVEEDREHTKVEEDRLEVPF